MGTIEGRRERCQRQTTHIEEFYPKFEWKHAEAHVLLVHLHGFKEEEVTMQVDKFGTLRVTGERQVSEKKKCRFNLVFRVPGDSNFQMINGKLAQGVLCIIMPKIAVKNGGDEQKWKEKKQNFKLITKTRVTTEREESTEKSTNGEGREMICGKEGLDEGKSVEMRDVVGCNQGNHEEGGERKGEVERKCDDRRERIGGKLDNGFVDGVWEAICNNRKFIYSAGAGLSLGLYISHKLRSRS